MSALTAPTKPTVPTVAPGPRLHVDPAAIATNTHQFVRRAPAVMAVVKADGFGHGAELVAHTALAHGATWLGVTSLHEASTLRRGGLAVPILSWLNPPDADWAEALRQRIDVAVPGREHLDAIATVAAETRRRARVHLHLDTGMARDGADPRTWARLATAARAAERRGLVEVVGIMGHLGCAEEPGHRANRAGRETFVRGVHLARRAGLRPRVRHLAATAATLTDPLSHFDLVRVGAGLVGIDPSSTTALAQPLTLTAPVVTVRRVPAGTGVGYLHRHVTDRPTHLGLLPVGYADGIPRAATGRAEVLIAGRRRPVVGLVSMDQVVVDLGDAPVPLGTEATVLGPGHRGEPTLAEWATWSETIPHEIVTRLGDRLLR